MNIDVIVPAAGSSLRLGLNLNKALLEFLGQPLVFHTVHNLFQNAGVGRIILVIRKKDEPRLTQIFEQSGWLEEQSTQALKIIYGGASRAESVCKGLQYLKQHSPKPIIAVHDAARPFITPTLFNKIATAAQNTGAALPVLPIQDTVRHKLEQKVIERGLLYRCQTPQMFKKQYINCFFSGTATPPTFTDDISFIEAAGHPVSWVQGEECNFKLTTQADIKLLPLLYQQFQSSSSNS